MPQKLLKCFDENGLEIKWWRWDLSSHRLYHYRRMDNQLIRFSTGVECEPLEKREIDGKENNPWPKIPSTAFSKALRDANVGVKTRTSSNGVIVDRPFLRDVILKLKKKYESRPNPEGKKNHTLNSVRSAFSKIDEYWGNLFADQISAEEWDKFQDWWDLRYPGYNSFNVTKYMRVLRNYCIETGTLKLKPKIIDRNKKIQRIKRNKKKDWVYTSEEIIALDRIGCVTNLERIVIRLGYQNAFRISDALSVRWSQFLLNKKNPVYKFQGDDKAETYVGAPLTDELVELISAYPKVEGSDFLFPQKGNLTKHIPPQSFDFHAIKRRANVTRGTFHALRHYRLSHDFKNTQFTVVQVCLLRRVSLKQAFDDYIHIDERDLELLRNAGSLSRLEEFVNE
jgi:integrase